MEKVLLLNKKEGETPLECLGRFRASHKSYKDTKMTYAGRLDPMAEGLLLVLAGDEVHKKEKYLKLNKTYEFEVLFGFSTDTYDILGRVEREEAAGEKGEELKKIIKKNLRYFTGKIVQKVPAYSTKTWEEARGGKKIKEEKREVKISKLNFSALKSLGPKKLLQNVEKRIKKVKGDFRQKETLKIWRKNLENNDGNYYIGKFSANVSSGTYVRAIANDLGHKIKTPALAYSIRRTKIGKYSL
jgi:tRNA pseudouridine55 synthase